MTNTTSTDDNSERSPWLTRAEAAQRARCSEKTVWRAAVQYKRTGGKSGLRGTQKQARGSYLFHVHDVDRWIAGENPVKRKPSWPKHAV